MEHVILCYRRKAQWRLASSTRLHQAPQLGSDIFVNAISVCCKAELIVASAASADACTIQQIGIPDSMSNHLMSGCFFSFRKSTWVLRVTGEWGLASGVQHFPRLAFIVWTKRFALPFID